jgi:hypothetical protein
MGTMLGYSSSGDTVAIPASRWLLIYSVSFFSENIEMYLRLPHAKKLAIDCPRIRIALIAFFARRPPAYATISLRKKDLLIAVVIQKDLLKI